MTVRCDVDSYWRNLTTRLIHAIERAGWRVERNRLADNCVGSCDYDKRAIYLDDPDAREEFVTLCHENGHRLAFVMHQCRTERAFRLQCPLRSFRETQAMVMGWQTCRRYTKRISLREWIKLNKDYGGRDAVH